MLIKIGYDIELQVSAPMALIYLLHVHPSRHDDLQTPENFHVSPSVEVDDYIDYFGNHCGRINVPSGVQSVRFTNDAVVADSGLPDQTAWDAWQHDPCELPVSTLQFLLASRYCEVDSELMQFAWNQFGNGPMGWGRVQAICDFVHNHLRFDYKLARPTRTALDGFREKTGVCRDFTHLAITLCRCMNIPARYCTGYLGDIRVAPIDAVMDFSAWFDVFIQDDWYTYDARHAVPRIGRVLMARGRDATDAALTTIFGPSSLRSFFVRAEEVDSADAAG
jgi:transglutaminase-like putative cysteine protease